MKPHLEYALWSAIGRQEGRTVRDIIELLIIGGDINSPKQAWRTLTKWYRKGIYDYGCCLDLGWKKTYERGYEEAVKRTFPDQIV